MKIVIALVAVATMCNALAQDDTAWTSRVTEDDFEETTIQIASVSVDGAPYRWASLFMNCHNGASFNLGMNFGYLNLTGGEYIGGSRQYYIGLKYGSKPAQRQFVRQHEDGEGIWLDEEDVLALREVPETDTVAVRLAYYKHGNVTIRFPMTGGHAAIDAVVEACTSALDDTVVERLRLFKMLEEVLDEARDLGDGEGDMATDGDTAGETPLRPRERASP